MKLKPSKQQLLGMLPDALTLTRGSPERNALYLSFDDGPHPEHTPRVLDLLAAHGAHGSFFLVGTQVEKYPQLAARIAAEGHLLGNHSWSHPSTFGKMTLQQQLQEIGRTDQLLAEFDRRPTHRFRPPRGSFSFSLLLNFAARRRAIAYWSYDSLDYQQLPVADVVARLRRQPPRAGDIVLMHDDAPCAGDVLEIMLPQWQAVSRELCALAPETR